MSGNPDVLHAVTQGSWWVLQWALSLGEYLAEHKHVEYYAKIYIYIMPHEYIKKQKQIKPRIKKKYFYMKPEKKLKEGNKSRAYVNIYDKEINKLLMILSFAITYVLCSASLRSVFNNIIIFILKIST